VTFSHRYSEEAFIGRNVKHESKTAGKPVDVVIVAIK